MSGSMGGAIRRYNHLEGEINAVYHRISLKLGLSDSAAIILYKIGRASCRERVSSCV